jgi:exodeoxyribonuclease V gamma subunit
MPLAPVLEPLGSGSHGLQAPGPLSQGTWSPGASTQAAATPGGNTPDLIEDPFADLRAWLMEPQRHWLAGLGLRPAEWDRSLEDLEPLSLGERERVALLRGIEADPQAPRAVEDWLHSCRGQGLLPPRNAAAIEARRLERRRRSLDDQALALGDPWSGDLAWGCWRASQRWQGGAVLVVHLGKPDAPHRLDLWLQLLLACAAAPDTERAPSRGVLLARDSGDRFSSLTLQAPDPGWAREELVRLAELRERWRLSCSPVPPRSGWCWWERERGGAGSGLEAARQRWEGDPQRPGERSRPEMVACFGGDLPVAELLSAPFADLAADLFEAPLAAADHDGPRPSSKRRGGG